MPARPRRASCTSRSSRRATAGRWYRSGRRESKLRVVRLSISRVANTTAARAAAVFLLLAGLTWLTMQLLVAQMSRDFDAKSSRHLAHEVDDIRGDIARTESRLDAAAERVAAKLIANPAASRAAMFAMLRGEANGVRQGIRIVAPTGDAIAWWGEDLRTPGATSL